MNVVEKHIIYKNETVREALVKLDKLASDAILFIVDENITLVGSLTDGDLRRGFIKGLGFGDSILSYIQPNPAYIYENEYSFEKLDEFRLKNFKVIPILNEKQQIVDIFNFRIKSTMIPADALIMAGGEGKRLRPLTISTPKPLLKIGDKPIIEHNVDRLVKVGIKNIIISINYLGEQIEDYFQDGCKKDISINYIKENKPLGTIGSINLCNEFVYDDIIVMNSDLLTNIDFADFYKSYKESNSDMAVATTSYAVDIPYAVLETDNNQKVISLKEKPKVTFYSNAGIYILNKNILDLIPTDTFFDITDLMEKLISLGKTITTYPINGYWLDVGKHEDFKKAQEDIKHLTL